ncbi:MAG: PorP/SprF family type IX secretion system membrane protein [Vicingaceae bacterium]|nr:PorP/SprF family type IX secretion system membrane protein [Vicingaceae bacterium]
MIKRRFYIILMVCMPILALGQDIHFTQFYSSAMYLNPAFTGAGVCSRLTAIYRNQWPGVSEGYSSQLASFDHYIRKHNLGMGLLFTRDVAGTGSLQKTFVSPSFAYEAGLSRKLAMRFGIQPGLGISSINFNQLVFGDQIARGGNVATIEDVPQAVHYFNVNTGVLFYTENSWAGASFHHINQPNESLMGTGNPSPLPIKYSIHGGHKFILNESVNDEQSISLTFNYRGQKKFDQLDIGGYYTKDVINVGIWYRGIPFLKRYASGYSNNDALSLTFGIKTNMMSFGYSYDITISRLGVGTSHGAHELTASYQFCQLSKLRKKRLFLPCPSF